MAGSTSGSAKGRTGKSNQMQGRGKDQKAEIVHGPAVGHASGGQLKGGFIAGRRAKGRA